MHEGVENPDTAVFMSLTRPLCSALDSLQTELLTDTHTKHIIDGILTEPTTWRDWTFSGGLLRYKGRLYLPATSPLIATLLADYHASLLGGHSGVQRTFQRLAIHFMWKGMHKSVKDFVQACDVCQKCKTTNHYPYGLLQPIPIPQELWADLSMDFVTHLPPAGGYTAILVVVDRFSKGIHLAPLPSHYTATRVAQVFWEIVGKLHGMPKSIISDRDPIFQSTFWKELFRLQGTQLRFSSAYHPESDGQTERINRCVEQFLRAFVHDQPSKWAKILSWAEFHHNTTFTAATGMTPFEATYGRKPPSLLAYGAGTSSLPVIDHDLTSRDAIISQLKTNLAKAQEAMKFFADKHRKDYEFQQGQLVLLKLQPFRQLSLRRHSSHKLSLRYYGPYKVLDRIGPVAYRLELPPTSRIHPVFHCSLLKAYKGAATTTIHPLPESIVEHQPAHFAVAILQKRTVLRNTKEVTQVLVQWSDLSLEDASWEDENSLDLSRLEDKSPLQEGRNVAPILVYTRRSHGASSNNTLSG
jgi:Integrase zinc binding domain/Integrase core domain